MKKYLLLILALCFGTLITSCDSTTEPTTDGSTLIVPSDTLFLSSTDSAKMMDLTLSCGCGFTLEITSLSGDTETIEVTPLEAMNVSRSKHSIAFSYSPSSTTTAKTLKLNFLAKKSPYSYTNSVVVKVIN